MRSMRSLIQSKRRHFFNLRASFFNYLGKEAPKPDEILVNEGTAALVRELGDAQRELQVSGHHFGQFSTTIVIYGQDLAEVRKSAAECYKVFAAKGAHLTEESYNLLNAFLSILPGNSAFNLRRLWLSSRNAAAPENDPAACPTNWLQYDCEELLLCVAPDVGYVSFSELDPNCVQPQQEMESTLTSLFPNHFQA